MKLDAQTLLFSLWAGVTLMAAALSFGTARAGTGLRAWTAALWWQSFGWAFFILASLHPEGARWEAPLGVCGMLAATSAMYVAAQRYLQRPPVAAWVWAPPIAGPLVYVLLYPSIAARVVWIDALLQAQMLWLAWLLRPWAARGAARRWRLLAFAGLLLSTVTTLMRTAVVLASPDRYPSFVSGHWLNLSGLLLGGACLMVGTLAFLLAHRQEAEQAIARLASFDGLTGLLNHRALLERSADQMQLALRHGRPVTVLMLDLDHFKQVNARHGHAAADRVLTLFAELLMDTLRQGDLAGRYGGEEFCVLLALSDMDAARTVDRRLRERLLDELNPLVGFEVDFSAGTATAFPGQSESLSALIARADQALQAAKHAGRGQLVCDVAGTPVRTLPPLAA